MTLLIRLLSLQLYDDFCETSPLRFFDSLSKLILFSCNFFRLAFSSDSKSNRTDLLSNSPVPGEIKSIHAPLMNHNTASIASILKTGPELDR